jgi:hypothetical protein
MDSTVNPTPTYCQAAGSIANFCSRLSRREKKPKLLIVIPSPANEYNPEKSAKFLQALSMEPPVKPRVDE